MAGSTSSHLSERDFLDAPSLGTIAYRVPRSSLPQVRRLPCPVIRLTLGEGGALTGT